jgi:hypothetical protein
MPAMSIRSIPIRKTTADRNGLGHVGQRGGQEQHQQHDRRGHQERKLGAPVGAVDHLGLGGAAVDDKSAGNAGADVGEPEPDEIGVLAETLVVAGRIGAGRGRTLSQDDHEHGKGDRYQAADQLPAPRNLRQSDMGRSTGDTSQHVQVPAQIQCPAERNGADDGDQRPGDLLREPLRADDDPQYRDRDGQGMEIDLLELVQVGPDLAQGAVPARGEAEHPGDLPERDLHADPGQEAHQHRPRGTRGR